MTECQQKEVRYGSRGSRIESAAAMAEVHDAAMPEKHVIAMAKVHVATSAEAHDAAMTELQRCHDETHGATMAPRRIRNVLQSGIAPAKNR